MKLFIKLMLFMVCLAMAGPFLLKGPDGKPLLTLQKLGLPSSFSAAFTQIKNQIKTNTTTSPAENTDTQSVRANVFYKWQNSEGVWQFTVQAPPPPVVYSEIHTDPKANIIQSLSKNTINDTLGIAAPAPSSDPSKPEDKSKGIDSALSLTTVPVTQIPKLMDDAKKAREIMEKRQEDLDAVLGDESASAKKHR